MVRIENKIITSKKAASIAKKAHQKGKIVVVTNGCFDLLHAGHVRSLKWAKEQADILIVALNSDASVKKNKGASRPIIPASDRALVLAGLHSVDYVYIFSSKLAATSYKKIKPDIWVKSSGDEKHPDFLATKMVIESRGGKIRLCPQFSGRSTTNIIKSIQDHR